MIIQEAHSSSHQLVRIPMGGLEIWAARGERDLYIFTVYERFYHYVQSYPSSPIFSAIFILFFLFSSFILSTL